MEFCIRLVLAIVFSTIVTVTAYRRRVLDRYGAASAFFILSFQISAGWRYFAMILVYLVNSAAKKECRKDSTERGPRSWTHVWCNDMAAAIMVLIVTLLTKWEERCLSSTESSVVVTAIMGGIIAHFSCCGRDSWASDILWMSDNNQAQWAKLLKAKLKQWGKLSFGTEVGAAFVYAGLLLGLCSPQFALKELLLIPLSALAGNGWIIITLLLKKLLYFSGFLAVKQEVVRKSGQKSGRKVTTIPGGLMKVGEDTINLISLLITSSLIGIACACIF